MAILTNLQFFALLAAILFIWFVNRSPSPTSQTLLVSNRRLGSGIHPAPPTRPNLILDPSNRRINVPSRLIGGLRGSGGPQFDPQFVPYELIGVVHSTDPNEDTIFNLFGRRYPRDSNRFQYRILDKDTGITVNLNGGDPMPELYDNDQVQIIGKESVGDFTVLLNPDDPYLPRYL